MTNLSNLENCWLSPTGRVITDSRQFFHDTPWHENLANCILRDIWGLEDELDAFQRVQEKFGNTSTEELEHLGYIRLHGFGGLTPKWIIPLRHRLTKKQESVIVDWCNDNNILYDNCFSK